LPYSSGLGILFFVPKLLLAANTTDAHASSIRAMMSVFCFIFDTPSWFSKIYYIPSVEGGLAPVDVFLF
jgi:hypothetical protein